LRPIYDPSAAAYFFAELVGHHMAVFVLAVFNVLRKAFRQSVLPLFWIFAMCHDLVAAGRWGSNFYYFLPMLAASAMLAALELSVLLERWRNRRTVVQVIAATLTATLIVGQFWSIRHGGAPLLSALGVGDADRPLGCGDSKFAFDPRAIKTLRSVQEPVLTDCPELKLINGSRELKDPAFMVLTATTLNGNSGKTSLLNDIQKRRFAMLALDEQLPSKSYRGMCFFWPRLRQAIAENYAFVPGLGPLFLSVRKRGDSMPIVPRADDRHQ
jgi:hypothetical protein